MAEWAEMGIQMARDKFRTVVDDALIRGKPTAVTRHGQPAVAVIPWEWVARLPADLWPDPDPDEPTSSRYSSR